MGLRRLAREIVLRMLFQYDASPDATPGQIYDLFCRNFDPNLDDERVLECREADFQKAVPYAEELFFGVTGHLAEVDQVIEQASNNWRIYRMSRVDRNVLRLGVYEMLFHPETPLKVSINEAIDLGKDYGTDESGAFVNGVLDRIHHQMEQNQILVSPEKKVVFKK